MMFDKVKIGICIPTAGMVRSHAVASLCNIIASISKKKLWDEAQEVSYQVFIRDGSVIATSREAMVQGAINNDCTHVLFMDDDMHCKPKAFELLARRRLPIVGCNYRLRTPPYTFTALYLAEPRGKRGRVQTTKDSTGLVPADYMGFGLCLIETDVFKKLQKPWFLGGYQSGVYVTEDLPFFQAAREQGIIAYCDQDASKYVGHVGTCEYLWHTEYEAPPEIIERKPDFEQTKEG